MQDQTTRWIPELTLTVRGLTVLGRYLEIMFSFCLGTVRTGRSTLGYNWVYRCNCSQTNKPNAVALECLLCLMFGGQ